jgi:hypothetical protein
MEPPWRASCRATRLRRAAARRPRHPGDAAPHRWYEAALRHHAITGISAAAAARFLAQAAMGASRADIASVQSLGYAGWLEAQFALPQSTSRWDWLVSKGYNNISYATAKRARQLRLAQADHVTGYAAPARHAGLVGNLRGRH